MDGRYIEVSFVSVVDLSQWMTVASPPEVALELYNAYSKLEGEPGRINASSTTTQENTLTFSSSTLRNKLHDNNENNGGRVFWFCGSRY